MFAERRLHLVLDGSGAPADRLDDPPGIERLLRRSVAKLGGRILHLHVHAFEPQGVTAFALLAESHLAIHTWPESGQFAADLFFCGHVELASAVDEIRTALRPTTLEVRELERLAAPAAGASAAELAAAAVASRGTRGRGR